MDSPLNRHAKEMRTKVFKHMLETRGWKYKVFLRYLRLFKYFAFAPVRGEFLETYYTLMRYLDDVVDGDAPLPSVYENESDYILRKIQFSENPTDPQDEAEYLMLYCFELAERFNQNFREETKDILNSLLFDAKRREKLQVFPEKELMHHFHVLDVRGTIRATLKVFKEDPNKYLFLRPLGIASRYQFDLEDTFTDLEAGYVNISIEECELFGLTQKDFSDCRNSIRLKKWRRHHATEGLKLLEEHHRLMPKGHFSLISRTTFSLVYEAAARKEFKKVLAMTENLSEPYINSIYEEK